MPDQDRYRSALGVIFAAMVAVHSFDAVAQSGKVDDFEKAIIARMQEDVGKQFWINKAFNSGLELCPSSTGRFKECVRVFNTSFKITGFTLGQKMSTMYPLKFYKVEMVDGRVGYINPLHRSWFLAAEPTPEERIWIASCERNGPSIGLNEQQVITCFGQPETTNSTVTSGGRRDQLVYRHRGYYVYLENGVVTAVQSSR